MTLYYLNLLIVLLIAFFVTIHIQKYLIFFTIEKWQAYLDYVIDTVFSNIYATRFMTYISSGVMLDKNEKEFIAITREFLSDVKLSLGKLIYVYYIIYSKEDFRTYVLFKFMIKYYSDVASTTIHAEEEEQTKREEQ